MILTYRKTSYRSRAPDRCRASHTGWGSDSFVLIEAGGFQSEVLRYSKAAIVNVVTDVAR